MSAPVIEVDDVWVRLRGQTVLEGVAAGRRRSSG